MVWTDRSVTGSARGDRSCSCFLAVMAQQVRVQSCAWSVHMRIVICSNQRWRIRHGVAAMFDAACFLLLLLAGGAWQGWLRLQRQQAEGKHSVHCTQRPPHMHIALFSNLPPHSAASGLPIQVVRDMCAGPLLPAFVAICR